MGRFEIVLGRLKIVVGRCGSLWIVVDRCGSFLVLVTTLYRSSIVHDLKYLLSLLNVLPLKNLGHLPIACLHMTSRRSCWWSRTKAYLSTGN